MKKILFLIVALSIITGTSFALFPGLFPNTTNFPRIPSGDGTVGKVLKTLLSASNLENYVGDGTVPNSLALSGISASGYLKNTTNCPGTEKYIGIDNDGNRICGAASTILAEYGTVESQDCPADYYRIDESYGATSTGFTLMAGDVVKTAPSCTLTIVFADLSILRLDGDTTISLDLGTLGDGTSIVTAIIANGSIWGRILTETGSYDIGTETVVVGVRGTSVSVVSTGNILGPILLTATGWNFTKIPSPNNTLVDIIDSHSSTGAKVLCRNQVTKALVALPNMSPEKGLKVPNLGCNAILPSLDNNTASDTFAASSWIRKNTKKDVTYLYKVRALSGALLSIPKKKILSDEIDTTIPGAIAGALTAQGDLESLALCDPSERWWNERYGCQPKKVVAIADFTLPEFDICTGTGLVLSVFPGRLPEHHVCQSSSTGTMLPGEGYKIGQFDFITFSGGLIKGKIGGFSGKTITYELAYKAPPVTSGYILSFKADRYLYYKDNFQYTINIGGGAVNESYNTPVLNGGVIKDDKLSGSYTFNTDTLSYFIIGNNNPKLIGLQGIIKNIKILEP